MIIFPAIDIKDGKCVRLIKGDFDKVTSYKETPKDQATKFFQNGFNNIHIVDLDGALQGKLVNSNMIKEIIKISKSSLKIQIGGGIRELEDITKWIDAGVDRVIMGTAAVENLDLLKTVCKKFNNKIAVSLDVKDGLIALSGWKKISNIPALEFLKKIENFGVSRIIYTDIDKDGTKNGPNIKDTIALSQKIKIPFVVSGGISSIDDIKEIKSLNDSNIEGVIVGKSIYDGDIQIKELAKEL
ncbi:MAG: 1-(5-phosphoribosyl)-5-[(5-phosphoribosylamino)methylideneamino]imidazole-4-carboxamide isomerase [Candidatus Pelagibacter sp. TMED64]|nr:1-(5-phosphoribosyl)-5-[(5-phosphoribosylamino)methylideneamino]imidazole-4-carboxamide isomerase [Candidatus Pelagibacter sp.]OUU65550.1 MAG: 1-(5-phosphoribosyl)-5-[(5-phosphoribosylamino)methylideneamino]imidazole-4-carboxamide isomerase [Candidatus Pelagibacter sp. TMED64]|tara:strand:+ start:159 stop:884 length:726 start_codon:yes stop_codon:yes gene_type:complete